MAEEFTIKEYERAEAELRTRKRHANFYTHAALYVLVNTLLIIINMAFLTAFPWSLIPLVLWGVGLLAHYFEAFVWVTNDIQTWEAKVEHRASEIHSGTMA
ncbi:MAG: 2TM domain-containing protein [Ktedonobacteraceae bacterium]